MYIRFSTIPDFAVHKQFHISPMNFDPSGMMVTLLLFSYLWFWIAEDISFNIANRYGFPKEERIKTAAESTGKLGSYLNFGFSGHSSESGFFTGGEL